MRQANDALSQSGLTYGGFLVDGFDDKFLVVEGDVSNLAPGKADLWGHPGWERNLVHAASAYTARLLLLLQNRLLIILLVDVESQGVHSQPQLSSFLILDVEIVDPVHLQILGNLQILHHGFLSVDQSDSILETNRGVLK